MNYQLCNNWAEGPITRALCHVGDFVTILAQDCLTSACGAGFPSCDSHIHVNIRNNIPVMVGQFCIHGSRLILHRRIRISSLLRIFFFPIVWLVRCDKMYDQICKFCSTVQKEVSGVAGSSDGQRSAMVAYVAFFTVSVSFIDVLTLFCQTSRRRHHDDKSNMNAAYE